MRCIEERKDNNVKRRTYESVPKTNLFVELQMAEIEYYILGTGILNQANRKGCVENNCLLIISKK